MGHGKPGQILEWKNKLILKTTLPLPCSIHTWLAKKHFSFRCWKWKLGGPARKSPELMEQLTLPFQEEILKGKQEQHHQQLEGMFFYQTQVCLVCNLLSVVWLMMWYWNITYVAHLMQANHTLWTSAACCLKMKILFSIVSSLLAWRWKRLFLFSASYLLFEVCCKWRAAARFNVGRVCRERLNALPQTSYLSRISRIISVEKILSCGEISDFCKEFEQFMPFLF